MTVGEKIRYFRTQRGLLQKELAVKSKMSESAIRNYELGNRYPNQSQREAIAAALEINVFAISDPSFESDYALMHTLFELEKYHGLKTVQENGMTYLCFDSTKNHNMQEKLIEWGNVSEEYKQENMTDEEYETWTSTYPAKVVKNKR